MRSEIKIRQHDKTDCAAACISSICSFYGLNLPLTVIRDACGTDKTGTSLKGILDAAPKVGMSAKALKAKVKNIHDLISIDKPVILHLQRKDGWLHFVVLYEMDRKKALILDPEDGELHRLTHGELEELWSGYIVIMAPSPDFQKGERRKSLLSRCATLFKVNRKELLSSFVGAIIFIVIGLSSSLFLQQIIDKVLPSKDIPLLIFFSVAMLLLMGLSLFVGYVRSLLMVRTSIKVDAHLIMAYLNKLLELPLSFFSNRSSGELNSRIGDAYRIRNFVSVRLTVIIVSIISFLASILILFTYYWKLALLTLMFVPLYAILYKISDTVNKRRNKKIIEASARFEGMTIETISSIRGIRYFGSGKATSRKIEKEYVSFAGNLYRGGKNGVAFFTASDAITKSLSLMVILIGSYFVIHSELTIGEMVSFYTIVTFFTSPIMTLLESNSQVTEANIAAERLFEILDLDSEDTGSTLNVSLTESMDICVQNLSFFYPGRAPLFDNISFRLKKGQINAIIGNNGCGKSTLATLLMRGDVPRGGTIMAGDVNIAQIPLSQWRQYISIVPQRVDLFDGTILENISPDTQNADIDKIISLCKKVGVYDTILSFPEGLLSRTGERAALLSGGEKQKIALVRSLYREPKVLILDEVTSSVDVSGRMTISKLIRDLASEGITIILISHERESLTMCDNIIDITSNAHSTVEICTPSIAV